MALKRFEGKTGTLVVLEHSSRVLRDNPLGDPHVRKLGVWLPPQYDAGAGEGRGGASRALRSRRLHRVGARAHRAGARSRTTCRSASARLIHERRMGPAILVFPDCFTALGGNQYINSSALGPTPITSRAS